MLAHHAISILPYTFPFKREHDSCIDSVILVALSIRSLGDVSSLGPADNIDSTIMKKRIYAKMNATKTTTAPTIVVIIHV